MPRIPQKMNPPSMITFRDGEPGDYSTAALDDLQEIRGGSDQGSSAPSDAGELQFSSETDCSDAEEPVSSRGSYTGDKAQKFEAFSRDIQGVRESQDQLSKDLEVLKIKYRRDNMVIMEALEEYKLRYDALEQQITDVTEFQREIAKVIKNLPRTNENIDHRDREETHFQGALKDCQTRLLNLEQQQQQEVQVEMPEDTTAWVVLRKVISVLVVVLTAVLVCVSSLSHFVKPSGRMLSELLFATILYLTWTYWDYSFVLELFEMGENELNFIWH